MPINIFVSMNALRQYSGFQPDSLIAFNCKTYLLVKVLICEEKLSTFKFSIEIKQSAETISDQPFAIARCYMLDL